MPEGKFPRIVIEAQRERILASLESGTLRPTRLNEFLDEVYARAVALEAVLAWLQEVSATVEVPETKAALDRLGAYVSLNSRKLFTAVEEARKWPELSS